MSSFLSTFFTDCDIAAAESDDGELAEQFGSDGGTQRFTEDRAMSRRERTVKHDGETASFGSARVLRDPFPGHARCYPYWVYSQSRRDFRSSTAIPHASPVIPESLRGGRPRSRCVRAPPDRGLVGRANGYRPPRRWSLPEKSVCVPVKRELGELDGRPVASRIESVGLAGIVDRDGSTGRPILTKIEKTKTNEKGQAAQS
jgi:hypothetical protein